MAFSDIAALPRETFLFLGADPCHSPDREAQRPADCRLCGGETRTDRGDVLPNLGSSDPIRAYETMVVVCVCGRTHYQRQIDRLPARLFEPDPEVIRDADEAADKKDRAARTREAVTGKAASKGRVQYAPGAEFADYIKRVRARRRPTVGR